MRVLLDTHALLWWFRGDARLSAPAREAIADGASDCFVSAASAWEVATKHRLGRLPGVEPLVADFAAYLEREGFEPLPITTADALRSGGLPDPSRDPFDRMLIAQALERDLALVTIEEGFAAYGVRCIW
jgi:PIN domain nuclease of toxin-antitoxin system